MYEEEIPERVNYNIRQQGNVKLNKSIADIYDELTEVLTYEPKRCPRKAHMIDPHTGQGILGRK